MTSLVEQFTDGLNPMFVKDVRAALRGRAFRVVFTLVVVGAVAIAVLRLADIAGEADSHRWGLRLFATTFPCLCVALHGVVPILAFSSLANELDRERFESLEVSNLSSAQIVFGKLWTAAIQALLCASVFAPLFATAFLLQGLDALGVFVATSLAMLGSLSMCAVSLAFATMARYLALRAAALAVIAVGSVFSAVLASHTAASMVSASFADPKALIVVYGLTAGVGLVAAVIAVEFAVLPVGNGRTSASP